MAVILLADDDDILAELVRHHLERNGHQMLLAGDGEAALQLAQEHLPDLVILDAMMPIQGGIETLRLLREGDRTAQIPVMMLTSRKSEDDVVGALKLGANEYVTKPFRPQELAARVEALLRFRRSDNASS